MTRAAKPAYDPAARRAATLRRYGLTPPDYARILLSQNGRCGICERQPSGRPLHVDHVHGDSRIIRGLLCHRCNRALGYLSGSMELARASEYVTRDTGYRVPKTKRRR